MSPRQRQSETVSASPEPTIDRRRYRRVLRFFAGAFLRIFWHDFILRWRPLRWLRRDPVPRWIAITVRFRALALELGGVLIKLGQYLSARVDLLPLAVTQELAGLQDEVPAAPFEAVARQLEEDFGQPLGELFAEVAPEPLGAASLAQVHAARLLDGQEVVVKVLRPGIDVLVETDLAAIGRAIRWLKWWRFVRRRVDLEWLEREFAGTTRRELDLRAEGKSAERFTAAFEGDDDVYLPRIYWSRTAHRTLTEENVAFIKISDRAALRAAGIDLREVARKLYRLYMRQIFTHHFVHADPHPGNLFVRPLAEPGAFQIVFIDFGMVAEIPPRLRAALRRFLVGLGQRDAGQVIQALREAGYLLPGADLVQLEEALDAVFDRFWGVEAGRLSSLMMSEAAPLWREFGQLLLTTPVQVQVDLMFTGRAVELLSALTSDLDEHFNPWTEVAPIAEALAAEALKDGWSARLVEQLTQLGRLLTLPSDLGRVATLAQRGRLTVRSSLAPDTRRQLQRLEGSVDRLGKSLWAVGLMIAGALLYRPGQEWVGGGLMAAAVLAWLGSWWSRSR